MSDQPELDRVAAVIEAGPYTDTWESLAGYEPPRWFCDAKFGIFIHWGVYSRARVRQRVVPAEHVPAGRPEFEHHVATYGPHDEFGYKDFIPQFTGGAVRRRASGRRCSAEAGAQYVVPVAEHHDGFADVRLPPHASGTPRRWVRSATWSVNSPRPCAPPGLVFGAS